MMDSGLWGPHAWYFIESCALNLNDTDTQSKNKFVEFLETLEFILPCENCRKKVSLYIKEHPIPTGTKDEIVNWVIDLHNDVRRRCGKSQFTKSDVVNYYSKSHLLFPIVILIFLVFLLSQLF